MSLDRKREIDAYHILDRWIAKLGRQTKILQDSKIMV